MDRSTRGVIITTIDTTASHHHFEELDEDRFDQRFSPLHSPSGSDMWQASELTHIPEDRIWSYTEDLEGGLYLCPGRHWVNFVGYGVTTIPWPHEDFLVTIVEPAEDDEQE